ncbi:MAG: proline--tRNA ligase, partial [Abditibacteriales bacterium]|nr:proline--tRNA ligase [Abditibacteriales bacterium]
GRYDDYGDDLAKLKDRRGTEFCLGPTHEEVITDIIRHHVRSYRDLPLTLYQIQTKFRDEPRPRGGLIRGREFIMKDAYSFDVDEAGVERSFQAMHDAYCRIFTRCGFDFHVVEAEAGAIGGSENKEFVVVAPAGEGRMFTCAACGYAASEERAERGRPASGEPAGGSGTLLPLTKVATPNAKTVEQVTAFLQVEAAQLVKTLLYVTEGKVLAALIRGDRELNETKLARAVGASVQMADADTVERVSGAAVGFAGPVGLEGVRLIADYDVMAMSNFVTGANETDAHLINVNVGRDFNVDQIADLRVTVGGDACPRCATGTLEATNCIELGHIFKLGTKYSHAMGATVQDEEGRNREILMGCYGIGVSRIVAAAAEVSHDEKGIIWHPNIAPYHVHLLLLDVKDAALRQTAEQVYQGLQAAGIEVLYDDRDLRPGVKFAEADLIGIPYHIILGKRTQESGQVEIRQRKDKSQQIVEVGACVEALKGLLAGI